MDDFGKAYLACTARLAADDDLAKRVSERMAHTHAVVESEAKDEAARRDDETLFDVRVSSFAALCRGRA